MLDDVYSLTDHDAECSCVSCSPSDDGFAELCYGDCSGSPMDTSDGKLKYDDNELDTSRSHHSSSPLSYADEFLCARFGNYADVLTEEDMLARGDGEVQIESCGWEREIFLKRQPKVRCTDQILLRDFIDGSVQINDFVVEPDSDLGCGSFSTFRMASCLIDQGFYAMKTVSKKKARRNALLFRYNRFMNSPSVLVIQRSAKKVFAKGGRISFDEVENLHCQKDLPCADCEGIAYTLRLSKLRMRGTRVVKNTTKLRKSGNPFLNIERECKILKMVNHPNVVKLFEIMDDPANDLIYFVFEFMGRGSILSLPTSDPLKEPVITRYFRDILCGVHYLHSKSIIHRDLKPENMLINSFGRVKLIDFGLSFCFADADDSTRLPYGTPSFTAPECLEEEVDVYSGRAMEIWALGITLFGLLFGYLPYEHQNLLELYRMIREEPLLFCKKTHISLDMRSLLKRILVKDPKKRIILQDLISHYRPLRGAHVILFRDGCSAVSSTVQRLDP